MGTVIVVAYKTCRVCGEEKLRDQFGRDRSKRDGHMTICNVCNRAKAAAWQKANPERVTATTMRWYYRNLELARKRHLEAYYRGDPEKRNVARRAWKARNRDKVAAGNHRRRAARYDEESLPILALVQSDPCAYCGEPGEQIDHITPIADGGENHWSNIASACGSCNSRKGTRPLLRALLELSA